uniref:probable serine/threonine-protein kinase pXi isoform X2 n=1 Tax=Ciona intestinalis TaxID=7719 RepID=UPI000EF51BEC|nr:probable serine/threonine-protein kinase pXi isoform X2 [Ciona intestinalis]|eukprot:XP_026692385.1 probable serine/threonine-protein kinase pXi isoform X2 [Ciona intestinalis]
MTSQMSMSYLQENKTWYIENSKMIEGKLPRDYFDDITTLIIIKQAMNGILFLHDTCDIIHRDIKPTNFLLVKQMQGSKVKVCDFGLSRVIEQGNSGVFSNTFGHPQYIAPECKDTSRKIRKSSDVYSLGILFHYVVTNGVLMNEGSPSFDHLRLKDTALLNGLTCEKRIMACDIIKGMTMSDQEHRMTIAQVSDHPLFWKGKRKIGFYKEMKPFIQARQNSAFNKRLNEYSESLVGDGKEFVAFKIDPMNVPVALREYMDKDKKHGPLDCSDVGGLVRLVRNMDAHVLDSNIPLKVKKCIGFNEGGFNEGKPNINPDVFLKKLTGDYPQLLLHLYKLKQSCDRENSETSKSRKKNKKEKKQKTKDSSCNNPTMTSPSKKLLPLLNKFETPERDVTIFTLRLYYDKTMVQERTFSMEKELMVFYNRQAVDLPSKAVASTLKAVASTSKAVASTSKAVASTSKAVASTSKVEADTLSFNEFIFPSTIQDKYSKWRTALLENFHGGLQLYMMGNTLYGTRNCQTRIYFFETGVKKQTLVEMKKGVKTVIFSYDQFCCLVGDLRCSTLPQVVVTIVIGTEPKTQVSPSIIKLEVVPKAAEDIVRKLRQQRLAT